MAGLIEEVGARLVLLGKAEYLSGMRQAAAAEEKLGASGKKAAAGMAAQSAEAKKTQAVYKSFQTQADKVTKSLGAFGKLAAGGVAVGLIAATKSAVNYQQKITLLHTQAQVATSRLAGLSKGLLALSPQVAEGPNALADALYRVASATSKMGTSNAQMLAMTSAIAKLTQIGGPGTDIESTARVLGILTASKIKGFGSGSNAYQNMVAAANAAVGTGDMRMSDFVAALGTGLPSVAAIKGVGAQDLFGLISLLGDAGINGSKAGNEITHALSLLGSPSGVGAKAYQAIGLNPMQLGLDMAGPGGLGAAIGDLRKHLMAPLASEMSGATLAAAQVQLAKFGFSPAQIAQATTQGMVGTAGQQEQQMILTRAFGGAKQATPILVAVQQYDRLGKSIQSVYKGQKDFGDAWDKTTQTTAFKWKQFVSDAEAAGVKIGTQMLPLVNHGLADLQGVLKFAADHAHALEVAGGALFLMWTAKKLADITMGVVGLVTKLGSWQGVLRGGVNPAMAQTNSALPAMYQRSQAAASGVSKLTQGMSLATGAIGAMAAGIGGYEAGQAGGVTGTLMAALSGATAGFELLGPAGAVGGAAIAGLSGIAGMFNRTSHAADDAARATNAFAQSLGNALANGGDLASGILSQVQATPGSAEALQAAGISIGTLAQAATNPSLLASLSAQIGKLPKSQQKLLGPILAGLGQGVSTAISTASISGKSSPYSRTIIDNSQTRGILAGLKHLGIGGKSLDVFLENWGASYGWSYDPDTQQFFITGHAKATKGAGANLAGLYSFARPKPKHRLHGGLVTAGMPYIVGEHGAEGFIPKVDGEIIPHGAMHGRGDTYVFDFSNSVITREQQVEEMMRRATMNARARH